MEEKKKKIFEMIEEFKKNVSKLGFSFVITGELAHEGEASALFSGNVSGAHSYGLLVTTAEKIKMMRLKDAEKITSPYK